MALEDTKIPYEILVRFGDDGMPVGAHAVYRRKVVLDGDVLKDEVQMPEPIDVVGFPTSTVMSDTARDALAQVTSLSAQIEALQAPAPAV